MKTTEKSDGGMPSIIDCHKIEADLKDGERIQS